MNILIVEDDIFLAERIWKLFQSKIISNRVRIVHSFLEFLDELSSISSYDIILTDLKLIPWNWELCGYKVIRAIREKNTVVPVVVMSWFSDLEQLRLAFEYGANDYVIKPIRLKELELRIMNWFKNYYFSNITSASKTHCYKALKYDIDKNEFYFYEKQIPLTKNGKYILSIFFSQPEKLLHEQFLVEKIWGDVYLTENRNLRVNILRLKQALRPFWIDTWIQNIRWEWYMLYTE